MSRYNTIKVKSVVKMYIAQSYALCVNEAATEEEEEATSELSQGNSDRVHYLFIFAAHCRGRGLRERDQDKESKKERKIIRKLPR